MNNKIEEQNQIKRVFLSAKDKFKRISIFQKVRAKIEGKEITTQDINSQYRK